MPHIQERDEMNDKTLIRLRELQYQLQPLRKRLRSNAPLSKIDRALISCGLDVLIGYMDWFFGAFRKLAPEDTSEWARSLRTEMLAWGALSRGAAMEQE